MNVNEKIEKYLNTNESYSMVGMPVPLKGKVKDLVDSLIWSIKHVNYAISDKNKDEFLYYMATFLRGLNKINYVYFDGVIKPRWRNYSKENYDWDWDLLDDYVKNLNKSCKNMKKIAKSAKRPKDQDKNIMEVEKILKRLYTILHNIEDHIETNIKQFDWKD